MMIFKYQLGGCEVLVEVSNVIYQPPVDKWLANSDWECYGELEFDWDVVEMSGELEDYDEKHLQSLIEQDIIDGIRKQKDDF